jgi:hypothetical protein
MFKHLFVTALISCALPSLVVADQPNLADTRTEAFREADWHYVERALEAINRLTQSHFGSSLQQRPAHDLPLLQRLLDERIVPASDHATLQAMGIALGEVLRGQRELQWRRYFDAYGVSRALHLKHSDYTLFPITMISRRATAGLAVDVAGLHQKALTNIAAYKEQQRENHYNSL